jgi:DNA-binding transcriptional regulator YdaS (Cro superfamily)
MDTLDPANPRPDQSSAPVPEAALTPAQRAVKAIGGVVAVAKLVGISPQAVSQWDRVPAPHAAKVAAASGVPAHELRPDIFTPPAEPAAGAQQETQGA